MSQAGMVARPGVVWITGYSGAGKTTVARHVEAALRERVESVISLDGDDLRKILAGRWGYEDDDRRELARVYFRLCSHLSSQGSIVVISAVAMFKEVQEWVRDNVPGVFIAYLDVPREVRIARDAETKGVYRGAGEIEATYDEPADPDLRIANHGPVTALQAATRIVEAVLAAPVLDPEHGRAAHWAGYYSSQPAIAEPSPFGQVVAETLPPSQDVLDVGAGDGRDSAYLAARGHRVVGLDPSAAATERARRDRPEADCTWVTGRIDDHVDAWTGAFDVVYSRFVLHSMTEHEEQLFWDAVPRVLRPGGRVHVECRSINDSGARRGEVLSRTERIDGHYRRYAVPAELERRAAAAGLEVESVVESAGLAPWGDQDPVVVRLVARRA
ncbi:adenylyl-sulfate kinase [Nocardioides sp. YIM 152315]|uniref:adenylyl-sulfate kinase n=1 Tax=Nocardioides sp. YIM 152315 TaxID=3031760 RepID=UPI0023DB0304|nr:adenylyl-sulfate kinase [Nocardioides sp. YIM 152315]MDF1604968.1 adenylyl-sulfate kinase [Nocardioides sp. YIM 152315]